MVIMVILVDLILTTWLANECSIKIVSMMVLIFADVHSGELLVNKDCHRCLPKVNTGQSTVTNAV